MGRRAKYSTQKKYQAYIDVVMRDLKLTGKVFIEWEFGGPWRKFGGDAYLSDEETGTGMRYGRIRLDKTAGHAWTIRSIMHELKHIQQRITGKMSKGYKKAIKGKRGAINIVWVHKWMGVETQLYTSSPRNPKLNQKYMDSPWEIEARDYEKQATRLFPNNKVQDQGTRTLLGKVGKTTFYKITP